MPKNDKAVSDSALPFQDQSQLTQNLRYMLRHETRPEHDQLDEMVSRLDMACRRDFGTFVDVHLDCFTAMQRRLSQNSLSTLVLSGMIDGLKADSDLMRRSPSRTVTATLPDLDPLAIDYIVAGSRLGSKVLQKRWATSKDTIVRRANHYFDHTSDPMLWRETCDALSGVPAGSQRAQTIVRDSKILFQFFAAALLGATEHQDALT